MAKIPEKITEIPSTFGEYGAALNGLIEWARKIERTQGKKGIKFTATEHNCVIEFKPEEVEVTPEFFHPFKVYLSDISDAGSPKVKIITESRLYTSLTSAAYTISSLTTEITLGTATKIWLKGTVSSSGLTAATITTTNPSSTVTVSGTSQTEFHLLIGRVTSGANPDGPGFDFTISGTTYHFEQTCFSHLLVQDVCLNGVLARYPFPFTGA